MGNCGGDDGNDDGNDNDSRRSGSDSNRNSSDSNNGRGALCLHTLYWTEVRPLNNIIQYTLILGTVTLFFGVFYGLGMDKLAETSQSQSERLQVYKSQVLEELTLVEIVGVSDPAAADVMNTGSAPIVIKRVVANGTLVSDTGYDTWVWSTNGASATAPATPTDGVLRVGEITRINVTAGSVPLFIVTENDRMFVLGGK